MNDRSKLSIQQQMLLGLGWLVPWAAFGVLALDLLPVHWRFGQLPVGVEFALILLFMVFNALAFGFTAWYFVGRHELEKMADLSP